MSKKKDTLIFEGKLKDIEKKIIDYYKERANFTGQSDTLSTIIGYLSIHGDLTQSQLKMLTNYSKSTISTGLSNLLNIGYVKKNKISGKREYQYSLSFTDNNSIDDALGSAELEINFLQEKIRELDIQFTKKEEGYELLMNRLNQNLQVFVLYQKSLEIIKNSGKFENIEIESKVEEFLTANDFKLILTEFDPKLKEFENEIIDFFKYQTAYSTMEEFMFIIFYYFITRKILTQSKIQELTRLSLGKISQVVNDLKRKGHINKIEKEKYKKIIPKELERQKIYAMISIKKSFFLSGINSLKEMLKWEDEFNLIQINLEENKDELEKLQGYHVLKKIIRNYLDLMQIYKTALNIFQKILR